MLRYVPDHLKTLEMCERAVEKYTQTIELISCHLKTQEMCGRAVEKCPYNLALISDHFKTQEMCNEAVDIEPLLLAYVPDLFVTQQQIKIWHDDAYYCNNDKLIKWYEGCQKWKAQKAKIKKELMRIAWHPSRYWDWRMSEDEKRETEKLWA